jgi:hypothetical protein
MQILVGPADAVGLEPVAVGTLPFSVVSESEPYLVQGGGDINYSQVLEEEWGTYTVTLDMQSSLSGECVDTEGGEVLNVTIESSGEQMVEVRAEGMQGDYPWSGTRTLELSFPLVDGATAQGEGWSFVLHFSE